MDTGSYEPKVSMILKELLSVWPNESLKKTILLDVGANLGIYGLYVAKLGFRVWAVEPQETNLIKVSISKLHNISHLSVEILFLCGHSSALLGKSIFIDV